MNEQAVFERYQDEVYYVQTRIPDAVLAGGAVRDTLLGRTVKDRDYLTTQDVTPEFAEQVFGTPFHYVNINAVMYSAPDGGSGLRYVVESEDKSINILICSTIEKKLRSFPDDISMVWFDGDTVHYDPKFLRAVSTKAVVFAERSRASRLSRLQEKYGNEYTFTETLDDIIS